MDAVHPVPKRLKLVIGGNELDKYPGFNGQFTRPVIRIGSGSYFGNVEAIEKGGLKCNP